MIRLGALEIGIIILIILMVFGAGKLPQIFEMVGKGVRSLTGGKKEGEEKEVKAKTRKKKSTCS